MNNLNEEIYNLKQHFLNEIEFVRNDNMALRNQLLEADLGNRCFRATCKD